MFEGEDITNYIKQNLSNDALTLYSIRSNNTSSKEELANDILKNGISLTNDIKFRSLFSPKGLVRDIKSLEDTIIYKTFYHEKDICNVVISTPQTIVTEEGEFYIGYPKDNVSGYTTAEHQNNYDCYLTDYLDKVKKLFSSMVVGYYYEDSDGNRYFKGNEKHYSKLKGQEKNEFFNELLEKVDNKITNKTEKKEILEFMKNTIMNKKCDNNSKFLTVLEYLEYKDSKFEIGEYSKEKFVELLKDNYSDYSLYLHGVDQETPKASKNVCNHILRSVLHIDWEYGFSGTCEPKGPIDENENLFEDLSYHYHGNDKEDYNIIILIPKVLEDLNHNKYFIGYSKKNTTGGMPKNMCDFNCLASDIINDIGYVPKEFIFGYQVFGNDVEEKFYINTRHISFLNDDLQRIISTELLNRNDKTLIKNLNVFCLNNIDLEEIESYSNPLIQTRVKSSMQNTSLEYFDYIKTLEDDNKIIEGKSKSMIK